MNSHPLRKLLAVLSVTVIGACADDPVTPAPDIKPQASMVFQPTLYALGNHTCLLKTTNEAFCWGRNTEGQIGLRTNTAHEVVPQDVLEPDGVAFTSMGGGTNHTCGIATNGEMYCWGYNFFGQLGTRNNLDSNRPRLVNNLYAVDWSSVTSGGGNHTCAVASGIAYCWGSNHAGQLGTNSLDSSNRPRLVKTTETNWLSMTAGFAHTCAVTTSGVPYCWGEASSGQLGVGSGNLADRVRPYPVRINGLYITQITAGRDHTCALALNGTAHCWGSNIYGQAGVNSLAANEYYVPRAVRMPTGVTFTQISAGDHHTCALGDNQRVYCWGYNISGQLGNGTSGGGTEALRPMQVLRPTGVNFKSVSAKYHHSCAMSTADEAYCWGVNTNGELGVNDNSNRTTPTLVLNGPWGAT